MTAHSLLQLRIAVRDRAHVSAKDPRFNDDVVNRSIQQAVGEVTTAIPGGWWFHRVEVTLGSLGDGSGLMPLALGTPPYGYVEGVAYVFASLDFDYWQPIRQRSRTDAIRYGGGIRSKVDIPESWGVQYLGNSLGQPEQLAVVFDPPDTGKAVYRVGVNVVPPDFVNDTDLMSSLPVQFTGAVVERASARLVRVRREVGNLTTRRRYITAATLCDTAFEGWMTALRTFFSHPYGGSGFPKQHWRV